MDVFKKKYKKLYNYYKKELQKCHKHCFNTFSNCMDYFITYLMFMRDTYLLTEEDYNIETNLKLSSLCMAVNEYERYSDCINNYYLITNNGMVRKDLNLTPEQTQQRFADEQQFHLNTFWGIVQISMESWCNNNDLTI